MVLVCTQWLELFLTGVVALSTTKALKYKRRGALSFDDYWLVALICAIFAVFAVAQITWLTAVGATVFGALFVFLWADSLVFRLFSIELEPAAIRMYYREVTNGFANELAQTWRYAVGDSRSVLPVFCIAVFPITMSMGGMPHAMALVAFSTFSVLTTARNPHVLEKRWTYLLAFALALSGCVRALELSGSAVVVAVAVVVLGWLVITKTVIELRPKRSGFLATSSVLRVFLSPPPLTESPNFAVRPEHVDVLVGGPKPDSPSHMHGQIQPQHIIVVTLESIGRDYTKLYAVGGAPMPFLESQFSTAVVSDNHFCISPNTANAFTAMYTGHYRGVELPCYLDPLSKAGFTSVYMTPGNVRTFSLDGMLAQCGFRHVFGVDDFEAGPMDHGVPSDHVLTTQGVSKLRRLRDAGAERLFVHFHTINTHEPYRLVDAGRFKRHDSTNERGRFLNCVEEADAILEQLFLSLSAHGFLDDALVIVTSDHGQAFGEFGYRYHSSAVIRQMINVPFMCSHSALPPQRIRYSSHFDIMPTVLDLLGIAGSPGYGQSIFKPNPRPSTVLYSETRRQGFPSNFGLVLGEKKIMVDLLADRWLEMNWEDQVISEVTGQERAYLSALFRQVLASRQLDRPRC